MRYIQLSYLQNNDASREKKSVKHCIRDTGILPIRDSSDSNPRFYDLTWIRVRGVSDQYITCKKSPVYHPWIWIDNAEVKSIYIYFKKTFQTANIFNSTAFKLTIFILCTSNQCSILRLCNHWNSSSPFAVVFSIPCFLLSILLQLLEITESFLKEINKTYNQSTSINAQIQ